jgi:ABC-type dipeptide/oligopeptide/nickel transport system permease subunit
VPGLLAGYWGGWVDALVMRAVDVLLAFPGIILARAIISVLGNGLPNVMVAVGIALIPSYVRLVGALTLVARTQVYVEAARCIGCGDVYLVLRHGLPNILPPIHLERGWWVVAFPGGAIAVTLLSINLLGGALGPKIRVR